MRALSGLLGNRQPSHAVTARAKVKRASGRKVIRRKTPSISILKPAVSMWHPEVLSGPWNVWDRKGVHWQNGIAYHASWSGYRGVTLGYWGWLTSLSAQFWAAVFFFLFWPKERDDYVIHGLQISLMAQCRLRRSCSLDCRNYLWMMNWKGYEMNQSWPLWRQDPITCVKGLRKTSCIYLWTKN